MKKPLTPLNESLNTLRRLSGITEQATPALSTILARFGGNEAGIIAYAEEDGSNGDCGRPLQELAADFSVNPTAPIQAQAQTTVATLVADVDKLAINMGFVPGAFTQDVEFWVTDWLNGHEGALLLVGVSEQDEDLGNCASIFCVKL